MFLTEIPFDKIKIGTKIQCGIYGIITHKYTTIYKRDKIAKIMIRWHKDKTSYEYNYEMMFNILVNAKQFLKKAGTAWNS